MIAYYQKQIDQLKEQYGEGVRPAWVGEEIGILAMQIEECKAPMRWPSDFPHKHQGDVK